MIVVLLNVYLVLPLHPGEAQDRSVQPVLEDLAGHRAAAAAGRPVHPDELGRAAGAGAGGAQLGAIVPDVAGEVIEVPVRRTRRSRPATCCSGSIRCRSRRRSMRSRRSSSSRSCGLPQMTQLQTQRHRSRLRRRAAPGRGRAAARRSSTAPSGIWTRPSCARPPMAMSPISRCARARASPTAAGAGDGLHRHDRDDHRHRDRPDRCALSRAGPAGRADLQDHARQVYTGKVEASCRRSRPARCRPRARGHAQAIQAAPFVVRVRLDDAEFARACRPAARRRRRSSPTTSRPRMSSARCCCARSRSRTTCFRSNL